MGDDIWDRPTPRQIASLCSRPSRAQHPDVLWCGRANLYQRWGNQTGFLVCRLPFGEVIDKGASIAPDAPVDLLCGEAEGSL